MHPISIYRSPTQLRGDPIHHHSAPAPLIQVEFARRRSWLDFRQFSGLPFEHTVRVFREKSFRSSCTRETSVAPRSARGGRGELFCEWDFGVDYGYLGGDPSTVPDGSGGTGKIVGRALQQLHALRLALIVRCQSENLIPADTG